MERIMTVEWIESAETDKYTGVELSLRSEDEHLVITSQFGESVFGIPVAELRKGKKVRVTLTVLPT